MILDDNVVISNIVFSVALPNVTIILICAQCNARITFIISVQSEYRISQIYLKVITMVSMT